MSILVALLLAAADVPASTVDGVAPLPGHPRLLALGIPEIPRELTERLVQYQNARAAELQDVAPDGSAALIATRFGSSRQLHWVERPLGARTQLTFYDEPILRGRLDPSDPAALWFQQDQGGAEQYQIYRLDRRTGRAQLVTDGKSRHEAMVVSRDGRRLAWSGTERNGKDTDVYVAEAARPREARRVLEGQGTFVPVDFSPDGERLLVVEERSIADADLWLIVLASGVQRRLTPSALKGSVRSAAFSADGTAVYLVTDRYGEFNELCALALPRDGAEPRSLSRSIPWDVEGFDVARDGSRVAFTVNAGGWSELWLVAPRTGKLEKVDIGRGVVTRLRFPDRRSDRLFLALQDGRGPSDVFALEIRARKLERWTRSEVGGLDAGTFVAPELVSYPSSDGVAVQAFLYRPPARFGGRRPVVVLWHGGPEAQSRPTFSPLVQFLAVEEGFAVLAPNVRGSDGYGKAFLALDDGVKRERALQDIGATLDFVASRADLDPARVAIYGGSYGGYMTLATAAFFPERVRAAIDVVGVSSIPSFLEHTQAYRRDLRRAEYGDERDPAVRAVQERISPLGAAARISAALLVVQGKNDPRVPQSEAEQIVRALRDRGREVWYLLALDEGHGFQKKENRDALMASSVMFLEREIGSTVTSGAPAGQPPHPRDLAPGRDERDQESTSTGTGTSTSTSTSTPGAP